MLDYILAKYRPDPDLPARAFKLLLNRKMLFGELYDVLPYHFHDENNAGNDYIPLKERKPSVRSNLVKTVVDDSVSLLFSEGHFPEVSSGDDTLDDALGQIIKDAKVKDVMIDAATRGSVGSVAILVRFLSRRVFLSVMETTYLTPTWKRDEPDVLERITELRKTTGRELRDAGYTVADEKLDTVYLFKREWTTSEEVWFAPLERSEWQDRKPFTVDAERTRQHTLGFVPVIWIKNLPGGDEIDGEATFPRAAVSTVVDIDYQMSQAGRGLKYSSDPTLLIKEPAFSDDKVVRSASNAITVNADGDAKLLEISGTASAAVIEYVNSLRGMALEAMHGNRTNADKLSAATSGRALELMHQALIWLADRLRSSYGEGALLSLYRMIIAGAQKYPITINGEQLALPTGKQLRLRWPSWFPPTEQDQLAGAQAIESRIKSGTMSVETAVTVTAADFDIEDIPQEMALIDADRKRILADMPEAQVTANASV
ncbi:MAG: phage portal protein [Burkholderiales bacterium]|nr:phage portal protein [Burkholderiales bacterium]